MYQSRVCRNRVRTKRERLRFVLNVMEKLPQKPSVASVRIRFMVDGFGGGGGEEGMNHSTKTKSGVGRQQNNNNKMTIIVLDHFFYKFRELFDPTPYTHTRSRIIRIYRRLSACGGGIRETKLLKLIAVRLHLFPVLFIRVQNNSIGIFYSENQKY